MTKNNVLPNEQAVLVGVIDPDAYAADTYTSAWVHMGNFDAIMAIVMTGTLGSSATVDAKLEQATDGSGTGVKDVTGKEITQLVKASNDDDQAIINCYSHDLDVANGFDYVRLSVTVGTATSDAGAVVLGLNARYQPAADLASVQEIV